MKKIYVLLLFLITTLSFAKVVGVGESVNGVMLIKANVVAPLEVKQITPMEFGDVILYKITNNKKDGLVKIIGAKNHTVFISFPKTVVLKNIIDKNYTATVNIKEGSKSVTLSNDGSAFISIGGTVGVTRRVGEYTGILTISARYN